MTNSFRPWWDLAGRAKIVSSASGFDILRLVLSLFILFLHVRWLGRTIAMEPQFVTFHGHGGGLELRTPSKTIAAFAVPMFFSLSGYLVAGSADRTRSAPVFLTYRVLRIIPALGIEVFLSALLLGPIFTTLDLGAYFTNPQFFRYFLNIVGHVTFQLPGVFGSNPVPDRVNVNLWTLPAEFFCYVALVLCMVSGIVYNRLTFTIAFAVGTVLLLVGYFGFGLVLETENCSIVFLVYFFMTGVFFYLWRDRIVMSAALAIFALAMAAVCICVKTLVVFAPPFIVYFTVFVGRLSVPYPTFLRKNDYSYGIYLYGFPITQALIAAFPTLISHSLLLRVLAFGITIGFAAGSWHLVEKRVLRLKDHFGKRHAAPTGAFVSPDLALKAGRP